MMKSRKLLLLVVLTAAMLGPGTAFAADEPATVTTPVTSTGTTGTDPTTTAPITIDPDSIQALEDQATAADGEKSVFEKASDFVTDNAPWFIIGIIVLAAIVAGILIMRGRPRRSAGGGTPRASKSTKAMRNAGGLPASDPSSQPAQTPSASELRRRKRAAMQRSREEERLRRKAGIEGRKAAQPGTAPSVPPAAVAGAAAVGGAGVAAAGLDPIEAEKQGARDQEIAAGAMARLETAQTPVGTGRAVPAPVSPSQTAPAAGVVTPQAARYQVPAPEPFEAEASGYGVPGPDDGAPAAGYGQPVAGSGPDPVPGYGQPVAGSGPGPVPASPEADTSILYEPSIENPGPDATVGNAAQGFLEGGAVGAAAGAAGGLAAARASQAGAPEAHVAEPLEPVIAPEPGMAPEHALADPVPVPPQDAAARPLPGPDDAAAVAAEERLRAKVAEIKATQAPAAAGPSATESLPEPGPLGPDADLSPGLAAVERKLSQNSEERDRALRDAEERLRRFEQRAEDAERRAAFAERLAQLKIEESQREKRLNDVVSGIDRAEQRAREAEARAESAERAAAEALGQSDLKLPQSKSTAGESSPESPTSPDSTKASTPAPAAIPKAAVEGSAPAGASTSAGASTPAGASGTAGASSRPDSGEAAAPIERKGLFGASKPASPAAGSDAVNLNSATFEELREAGLSVTQATRILAYRERFGGYSSVEDLEKVPGFPGDLIESLRGKVTI